MKKIAILLAGLALAAPAQAEALTTVRTNYVYEFAKGTCPKSAEIGARLGGRKALEFEDVIASKAQMTTEERSLLALMCFMYDKGQHDRPPLH